MKKGIKFLVYIYTNIYKIYKKAVKEIILHLCIIESRGLYDAFNNGGITLLVVSSRLRQTKQDIL